jgi:hypothetical protein
MVSDRQVDGLRRQVLAKVDELRTAVSAYTRATGRRPDFILGPNVPEVGVPPASLGRCRVLNDRRDIVRGMPNRGNVVEVGTHTGQFAHFILRQCSKVRLYTIDTDYSQFSRDALEPFVQARRLELLQGISWDELAKFPAGYFSWIYIDANHSLEHIRRDLAVAKSRVSVGGYLVCNDYTVWSPFEGTPYGVLPAVNEFLTKEDFEVTHLALHPFGYHDIALRRRS